MNIGAKAGLLLRDSISGTLPKESSNCFSKPLIFGMFSSVQTTVHWSSASSTVGITGTGSSSS